MITFKEAPIAIFPTVFHFTPYHCTKENDMHKQFVRTVFMGFLIALIVIIPILIRRKSWMENH